MALEGTAAQRVAAFAGAGGLVAYLAVDGAGFDLIVRQRVGLLAWLIVGLGFAIGVLPRGRPHPVTLYPGIALAALAGWAMLSLAWTSSAERTVAEIVRLATYGGLIVLALSALDRNTFRAAAAGMSAAAMLVAALSVASRLMPSAFPEADVISDAFRGDRLAYPLDYWNAVGAWGAMAAAIGLAWSAGVRSTLARAVALAGVPTAALAVYLSYSRGGVAALAIGAVAVIALSRSRWTAGAHALVAAAATALAIAVLRQQDQIVDATGGAGGGYVALALLGGAGLCAGAAVFSRRWEWGEFKPGPRQPGRAVLTYGAIAAIALVAALASGLASDAWEEFRTEDAAALGDDPAVRFTSAGGQRSEIWDSALDATADEPLGGIGPGTFEYWWAAEGDGPFVQDAHSLPLEFAAELGIPGLLLLLAFLGAALAAALRVRGTLTAPEDLAASVAMMAAFAAYLVSACVDWMWEETAVGALGLVGLAVAVAGGTTPLNGSAVGTRMRLGVAGLAFVAVALHLPGIVSTGKVRQSYEELVAGDTAEALDLARSARDWQPWAATPHGQLALVHRRDGDLGAALAEIEIATGKERANPRWSTIAESIRRQESRGGE